jgi:group I intron endonuclease
MTIGIYRLIFANTDKVYIGQSVHIEIRFKEHLNKLRTGRSSRKLQEAYTVYGFPTLEILTECTFEELDSFENETIEIWDSVLNGFNSIDSAGESPNNSGEHNGCSKYANEQVTQVLFMLIDKDYLSQENISTILGVSKSLVNSISSLSHHRWLSNEYPKEYDRLKELVGTRNSRDNLAKILSVSQSAKARDIVYSKIISPEGKVYQVDNAREFARVHNLNSGNLSQVLNRKALSIKGWKLQN